MDKDSPKEAPNADGPHVGAELSDDDSGAGRGMVHVGAAAEDENLLVANMEDDEKMLFNDGEQKDVADNEGEVEYKFSSGSKEQAEDTSMIPTSSHSVGQQEEGHSRA